METTSAAKGRDLEQAVKFIQETILSSAPEFKGVPFSVECNVRDSSSGVLHEIDVLVKTHLKSHYEATWVFECKNWAKPVGKNEIIILAEKVEALRANRGFIVAKTLTSEAEAQLELKPRLQFIKCTQDFLSPFGHIQLNHRVTDLLPIVVKVKERGVPPLANPNKLDWKTIKCRLNSSEIAFLPFIDGQVKEMLDDHNKNHLREYMQTGTHWGRAHAQISFIEGELTVDDMDVEYLVISIFFFVKSSQKKLLSQFELEGRGRSYSFEPIEDYQEGNTLQFHLVQKL